MTDELILLLYRERDGDPGFWAEPLNAISNASFLIAAGFALHLAKRRNAMTPLTLTLITIAATVGVGSFLFHTATSPLTKWLDIGPIALFQVLVFWVVCRWMLGMSQGVSVGVAATIVVASFALMPISAVLKGSLFYLPSLIAMSILGAMWAEKAKSERYLLVNATSCFAIAITARTVDWMVPWSFGTHFLWHLLNGVVVYLVLRTWIISEPSRA